MIDPILEIEIRLKAELFFQIHVFYTFTMTTNMSDTTVLDILYYTVKFHYSNYV
jgi:hypothetical protein